MNESSVGVVIVEVESVEIFDVKGQKRVAKIGSYVGINLSLKEKSPVLYHLLRKLMDWQVKTIGWIGKKPDGEVMVYFNTDTDEIGVCPENLIFAY